MRRYLAAQLRLSSVDVSRDNAWRQQCQCMMRCVHSRYEAQRLPDVVTSAVDPRAYDGRRTAYAPTADDVPAAPEFARPSRQWLLEFLADFQSIRDHLSRCASCTASFLPRRPQPSRHTACLPGLLCKSRTRSCGI